MFKYLLFLVLSSTLFANLSYQSSVNKELSLLESFDIEPAFLYDPIMNQMRSNNCNLKREKHFFDAMKEAYLFIPAIKNILAQYNIPQEFLYLAMTESNFKLKAFSHKKASGLWQFMPATGRLYHLKIDDYVDERRDIVKSTQAAAKYLTVLHKRFHKWYLAAIAYNCGEGKLNRAIKEAHSDELSVLLDSKKKYIPRESRLYIRKIIALALIGTDEEFLQSSKYGYLLNRANACSVTSVKVPGGESLKRVAKLIQIPLEELQQLNRHLRYDFIPPYKKNYALNIPYIKLSDFKEKYHKQAIENIYKIYIVKHGDNLSQIGKRYGVSYKIIMDFNKLQTSRLRLRQKLIIPIHNIVKKG